MKIYPKHNGKEEDRGFTADEIRRGWHWLYADVTCIECKKVQSLSNVGYIGGPCIKCGGKTQ